MKRLRNASCIFVFLFLLCFPFSSALFSMPASDMEKKVVKLFESSDSIPQVRITPVEKDRFIIELTFTIGDRWGRDVFVRDLAKAALVRVFKSNLPLAQGIVRVYCIHTEAVHLAVGVNQAKQIRWDEGSGPSEFFDSIRLCARWGKRPEDRTYLIEHGQIIKPSPVILFPRDS